MKESLVFAMALLLLSSLAFANPTILSPDNADPYGILYTYAACDNLNFKWSSVGDTGYSGTYYLYGDTGAGETLLTILPDDGNKNTDFSFTLPWSAVETFADGRYKWSACNQPLVNGDWFHADCGSGFIDKYLGVNRKTPLNGSTVTQNAIFTWDKQPTAKNYFAKAYGGILGSQSNPTYFQLGNTGSFALSPYYSLLSFGKMYYWNVFASCDSSLTMNEMKAFGQGGSYWNFKK